MSRGARSRATQIERALILVERLVTLIEAGDDHAANHLAQERLAVPDGFVCRAPGWRDPAIRDAILSLHGRTSSREVAAILLVEFGPLCEPSKSSVARIFQALDVARKAVRA